MEHVPLVVRRMVAAEQNCSVVHFFASFCDFSAAPQTLEASAFTVAAATSATPNTAPRYQLVYDLMRSRNGQILFKQAYAERFTRSLALAAPHHTFPPWLPTAIQARLQAYIETPGVYPEGVTEQNVKLVSWLPHASSAEEPQEESPVPVVIMLTKSFYPAESMYRDGAKLGVLFNAHRKNPNAKVAETAVRERANAFQAAHHVFEVLLVHEAADSFLVPEGSRSNYLLEAADGSWWCSAEEDILIGITLQTTYRVVEACGLGSVQHGKLTLKEILGCKSLYMLATSPTIMPVQSVLLYVDADTRRCFEAAVEAPGAIAAGRIRQLSEESAELMIPVNVELAAALRSQYFAEAALS